jgi:hypothetical protein
MREKTLIRLIKQGSISIDSLLFKTKKDKKDFLKKAMLG